MIEGYILLSLRGGWFTKSATYHSDFRQAKVFDREDAMDMCKLHSGRLLPVQLELVTELMKGVKS